MGKKIKIYISKSKAGSFDDIVQVKSLLNQFENVEVLEFIGGKYNTDKLDQSDIMLLIPPERPAPFNYIFNVGKGQYSEIERAYHKDIPIYYVLTADELTPYIAENHYWEEIEISWQHDWARIEPIEHLHSLENVMVNLGMPLKREIPEVSKDDKGEWIDSPMLAKSYTTGVKPFLASLNLILNKKI